MSPGQPRIGVSHSSHNRPGDVQIQGRGRETGGSCTSAKRLEPVLVGTETDAEITALAARRAKTQAIKQGMMQELLTGRTRLI